MDATDRDIRKAILGPLARRTVQDIIDTDGHAAAIGVRVLFDVGAYLALGTVVGLDLAPFGESRFEGTAIVALDAHGATGVVHCHTGRLLVAHGPIPGWAEVAHHGIVIATTRGAPP